MSLAAQLNERKTQFNAHAPEPVKSTILKTLADHQASFDPSKAIQVGSKLPAFTLPDATKTAVSSETLLAQADKGILLTFYRGSWCPFCSLELRALQLREAEMRAKGVTLVAVSPELPDTSLSTKEKEQLSFAVLSDVDNKYGKELGIVWQHPEEMRAVFDGFGHNIEQRNGNDTLEVPVPATLLIGKDGVVKNMFLDPDYRNRLEPDVAMEWIDKL